MENFAAVRNTLVGKHDHEALQCSRSHPRVPPSSLIDFGAQQRQYHRAPLLGSSHSPTILLLSVQTSVFSVGPHRIAVAHALLSSEATASPK
jgi:hypothetical protein